MNFCGSKWAISNRDYSEYLRHCSLRHQRAKCIRTFHHFAAWERTKALVLNRYPSQIC